MVLKGKENRGDPPQGFTFPLKGFTFPSNLTFPITRNKSGLELQFPKRRKEQRINFLSTNQTRPYYMSNILKTDGPTRADCFDL